jgi:methylated-DNA-[protein]-cysteine S-methyltransferase
MIGLYTKRNSGVWFGVACDEQDVFATTFGFSQENIMRNLLESIPFNVHFQSSGKPSTLADRVLDLVRDVYDGKEVSYDFSLATGHLSEYAQNVIRAVSLIPLGYVASYGAVAKVAGGSPRAVGRVMALNPFPPICPCHRVVSSDFTLGGYGGGLDLKLEILRRESRGFSSQREIDVNGKRLEVFPVEFVLRRLGKE